MNPHDAISDDGKQVICTCGRVFDGTRARDRHSAHQKVEGLRLVLQEAEERKTSG